MKTSHTKRNRTKIIIFTHILIGAVFSTQGAFANQTYTLDADFDSGNTVNLNHDPNHDQLQLNKVATPLPFVNIAASGRGTMVRIDVNTGTILGEYLTAPDGMGRNPSRTTVDQLGNVWVSNRDEGGFSGGQPKGSVARIGLIIGGTRADADGTINPVGQYLKPPFQYNTCLDRDSDGLIKTSSGLGNILPWTNTGGANTDGGVSTAGDECIINYTRVTGTYTRTVAIDANNNVWTGGIGDLDHEKISGITGLPIPGTQFNLGCGGYGGLVDKSNVLWSARMGAGLLRYDANTLSGICLGNGMGDYGLGIDPQTNHIWQTYLFGNSVCEIMPNGTLVGCYSHGNDSAQGVAVDGTGNVWVAHSLFGATTVGHLRTDGTYVGNVILPGGNGPTGVAVDANGKIWVANVNSNNVMRIDPFAGPIGGGGFPIGAVDLTVDLGAGANPYNYSDMTGFVSIGSTSPQGTWTAIYDSDIPGNLWGTITWNQEAQGSIPAGSSITVEARAADNQVGLTAQPFTPVSNGTPFSLAGQFIEVQATLKLGSATESPVLSDLSVKSAIVPVLTGRMTGGGNLLTHNGLKVSHAFELHCDSDSQPNHLQINWKNGNKFHLEGIDTATCSDDPVIEANPPSANFDTYKGKGSGRYNGTPGYTAEWTFTDAGEPGSNDFAEIVIKNPSGDPVISVSGKITGNHQAHK